MYIGFLLIVIGVLFLLKNLGIISGSFWDILWPIVVVFVGISMLFGRKKRH
jgi:hypothetical protein